MRDKGRTQKTINDYFDFYVALFSFAEEREYRKGNPAKNLKLKDKRRADQIQDIFTTEDLEKLFVNSHQYRNDTHKEPFKFWMPLIGLHTGMRLEEIGCLYVDDVKTKNGIVYFDINENRPDKRVKTEERRVPLHPFLARELNFTGYVKSLPKDGRVFSELKYVKNRYTHTFSQWFRTYKTKCVIKALPRKKTFHSFRHTLPTHLKQKEVNDTYISELLGHKHKGMTLGRYAKRYPLKQLYEKAVKRLIMSSI